MSLDLLDTLKDRSNYLRFAQFINQDTVSSECWTILKDMEVYFKSHPSINIIVWEDFNTWFKIVKHSGWKLEKYEVYDKIFSSLSTHTATELEESIVEKFVLMDYCQQIADISLQASEGKDIDITDIEALVTAYRKESKRVNDLDSYLVSDDIEQLVDAVYTGGYSWRMNFLNQAVGNLRVGKLVCFAARPNSGKTTWLASEATHIASQLKDDEVVMWFNNEEEGNEVKMRIIQAGIGWTSTDIRDKPLAAKAAFESAVGPIGKIVLVNKADINTRDCEEFIRNYNVKCIIFDQLWKIHGFELSSGTDTVRLGNIFKWAREIAKKYAPVITVHQVKTEGEGMDYIPQSMLYLSGTVVQGEVDTLIMMGKLNSGPPNNRYLNITKNKGAYGPVVNPSMREAKGMIEIVPETAEWSEPY